MNSEEYTVGGRTWRRSVVYKDNYSFGLTQKSAGEQYLGQPEQQGLVSYKPVGEH